MRTFVLVISACILSTCLGWQYPGYPGVDCPTAREKMEKDEHVGWMIPKCNKDKTFVDLQCYRKHPTVCMCVAPDGTPLTLPGYGLDLTTCVCFLEQYRIFKHVPEADFPKCANDGSFEPLQCSRKSGECWCVDRNGNVLVPPSKDVHSCNN